MQSEALFQFVERNDVMSLKHAFSHGRDGIVLGRCRNERGQTALMVAAEHGSHDLLQVLTPYSDPDAVDFRTGRTADEWALAHGHTGCAQWIASRSPEQTGKNLSHFS